MRKSSISLYDWCKENKREDLIEEWDFERNKINPKEVSRASKVKVYWNCKKCNNHFLMLIQNRTLNNSKCPKCSVHESHEKERKRRIAISGSLEDTRPELLNKWNYEKNFGITPKDVSKKSTIKVWWKCPTCGYEFEARISDVRADNSCIKCKGNPHINIGRDGKYCVYCHTCPDGKKYIGFTGKPLKIRFGNGLHYSKTSKFGKAIEKFGWENIKHDVLQSGLTKDEASQKEEEYISLYKTTQDEFGYNEASGGINGGVYGRKFSEETRRKISNSNKGRMVTQETKDKLRKSHLGKESHNVRAVIKMDLQGKILEEYKSIAEAVRNNEKTDETGIWRCCKNRRKTAGGYRWKYKN